MLSLYAVLIPPLLLLALLLPPPPGQIAPYGANGGLIGPAGPAEVTD